jgi:ferredoxin
LLFLPNQNWKGGYKMKEVLDYTREFFDALGVVVEGRKTFLILGLVSRPDRDLDIFVSDGRKWKFPGFYQHFTPRVKVVVQKLEERGFRVKQKKYSKLDVKKMAVKAGIGCWGKNSLVIHPKFGPWLRFVVLETNTSLEPTISELPNDLCGKCEACLRACPVNGLLEPYKLVSEKRCLAYLQLDNPTSGSTSRCDKCLISCPIGALV